ncbi:MAG: S1C family serine protease [Minwuia sp.]|nr:S1C family serine protease [Minwuia sp.]
MAEDEHGSGSGAGGSKTNGHKVNGHKHPALSSVTGSKSRAAQQPGDGAEELPFDLEATRRALTPVQSEIPENAFTAGILGTERQGGGIVIGANDLVLTIGYVVVEAESVAVLNAGGEPIEADVVAYDFESGLGLIRAVEPLDRPVLEFGSVRNLSVGTPVVASCGGAETIMQEIVGKRRFCGYWEYRLEEALFTMPVHPNWGGAALIGMDGLLYGVGSLYVEDATGSDEQAIGNMFVPIDLLVPVLDDLLQDGRRAGPARPWIGVYAAEQNGHLVIMGVAATSPAASIGLTQGDVVLRVNEVAIGGLNDFYDQLWGAGDAGVEVGLTLMRDDRVFESRIRTASRDSFLKIPRWES